MIPSKPVLVQETDALDVDIVNEKLQLLLILLLTCLSAFLFQTLEI